MDRDERRRYDREYARRKRERTLDVARRGHNLCPRRAGPGTCGGVLEHDVLRDGTIVTTCPRCDRRNRGICADCPARVEGRIRSAMRCRNCKRKARCRYSARYRDRDPVAYARKWRRQVAARRKDPVRHQHDLAVKKAWRVRNVVRIKRQRGKWGHDRPSGYSSRAKWLAYHAAYRAKHAAHRRELAKRRYYELHPDRPHPVCYCCGQPIPWDGRGRPAKWLREHRPYAHALTPMEVLMKGVERAAAALERARDQVKKKLAGVEELQSELAAIGNALAELRKVSSAPSGVIRGQRGRKGAQAA